MERSHDSQDELLVGPRAEEYQSKPRPENVQIEDGVPLYHALLSDPNAAVLPRDEAQTARRRLLAIIENHPNEVLALAKKPLGEAKAELEKLERGPTN